MTYPEGRQPIKWGDLTPKHSTWEAEAKALRARVQELEQSRFSNAEHEQAKDILRKATTAPQSATHSAKSDPGKG